MNNEEVLLKYKDFLSARKLSINYYNTIRVWLQYLMKYDNDYINFSQEMITNFFVINSYYKENSRNMFIKAGRNFYSEFLGISKENNQWFKIKLFKVRYEIPNFLSSEEISEAKKYLKTYHTDRYSTFKIDAILSFLFATGVRKSEFLNLKRIDFNMKENKAKVLGKGNKERYVYFNNEVKEEILAYFKTEKEELNAFNLTESQLLYIPQRLSKYLNKKIYLHLFRHSSARDMIMKDIPVNIVSKILGHSSIHTTLRYTDPSEQMISKKYLEKMK
jgi:integrase/recombinase XerC